MDYQSFFLAFCCLTSTLLCFPLKCSWARCLSLSLPFSLLNLFFPPSDVRCLHVEVHLQALRGMLLWAGVWQPLIRRGREEPLAASRFYIRGVEDTAEQCFFALRPRRSQSLKDQFHRSGASLRLTPKAQWEQLVF